MFNNWVNSLEWSRIRPWLFAVGSVMMASFQISDLRNNQGWATVLDWFALAFFSGLAIHYTREGLKSERARRSTSGGDPTP